ncbi:uncharacterized protein FIBRA_01027 [Fibroporia radiculosa]|uniref:Uncharacterized protein n=1 Tax=Fibroporia radiculosa TaxID=599839 RepID=J4G0R4_9APHY|nr:uncharacterized protein FIBRA_01027 [Fibroporia radiculosa]CCL99018.1 predicted protein [Fibroporia radiculosa]
MRRNCSPKREVIYEENGTIVVWQWLGFNRYLPPGKTMQKLMRGCASDYRNSESFKVLSAYNLPTDTPNVAIYTSVDHDPLAFIPMGKFIRIVNITRFQPRRPPGFPVDDEVVKLARRMHLDDNPVEQLRTDEPQGDRGLQDEEEADNEQLHPESAEEEAYGDGENEESPSPQPSILLTNLFDSVSGWDIDLAAIPESKRAEFPKIGLCEVAPSGNLVLGVGAKSTLYIWRLSG